jgi:hypothetical protein
LSRDLASHNGCRVLMHGRSLARTGGAWRADRNAPIAENILLSRLHGGTWGGSKRASGGTGAGPPAALRRAASHWPHVLSRPPETLAFPVGRSMFRHSPDGQFWAYRTESGYDHRSIRLATACSGNSPDGSCQVCHAYAGHGRPVNQRANSPCPYLLALAAMQLHHAAAWRVTSLNTRGGQRIRPL